MCQMTTEAHLPPFILAKNYFQEFKFFHFNRDNNQALQYLKEFQPKKMAIKHIRVLLYGPVGVGKSSFINSVNNVFKGRMTNEALASSTTSDQSFTKKSSGSQPSRPQGPQSFMF
ncbi:hypothetical protein ILYODFUR_036865 [Ilyodon furcidens]|uniref:G domain-containing protein n=1 Tax=Ilyodon furcidens TaxID=33524 RepID=A0ABV0UMJ5_9TELE